MTELSLLVLAAGVGQRYGGLKQVDPVGPSGETMLDYSLYAAHQAGIRQVVFVIRTEIEDVFRLSVGDYWKDQFAVRYVFQEVDSGLPEDYQIPASRHKPWGTGQAVLVGRETINSPFITINSDDFYGQVGFCDVAAWLRTITSAPDSRDDYCFVGQRLRNTLSDHGTVSRGVCRIDPDGYLAEVVEMVRIEKNGQGARVLEEKGCRLTLTGDEVVSVNFWGFQPSVFSHLERGFAEFLDRSGHDPQAEYFIPSAMNELLRARKIRVKYLPAEDRWFGITYREDLPHVRAHIRELIREGVFPPAIRRGGSRS